MVKNPPVNERDIRDMGLIPGSGRSPGGGYGNSLQYSCLESPRDRAGWQATVHRVIQSWTGLKRVSTHTQYSKAKSKGWLGGISSLSKMSSHLKLFPSFLCSLIHSRFHASRK